MCLTCKSIASLVQIENLLISNQGTIKLCDFGSSTTVSHYPDYSWSAQKRSMVEDEVCIHAHTVVHRSKPSSHSVFVNDEGKMISVLFQYLPDAHSAKNERLYKLRFYRIIRV